jgi:PAS domain S-box-containing protein
MITGSAFIPPQPQEGGPRREWTSLLDAVPQGLILVDAGGRCVEVNPAAVRILGLDRERLRSCRLPEPWSDLCAVDGTALAPEAFPGLAALGAGTSVHRQTLGWRRGQGATVWLEVSAQPLAGGGALVSFDDVTATVLAQKTLQASEERHRFLADNAIDVIWTMDLQGRFTYMSPSVQRLRGYTPAEAMAMPLFEMLPPAHAADIRQALAWAVETVTSGEPFPGFRRELELQRKDGTLVWAEVAVTAMHNPAGRFIGFLGVTRDIAERKRWEEYLTESETRFRKYVECSPIGIFECDEKGSYLEANPAASEITGYSHEELLTLGIPDLLPPEARAYAGELFAEMVARGHVYGELAFQRKDGRLGTWSVEAVTLSPRRFLGFASDLTERKRSEEKQRQLELQLQQAQKMESLGILVAGVAHNFNNVLALIMGTASIRLQLGSDPLDQEAYRTIDQVCSQGRDVVRSLLHFARPSLSNQAPLELHGLIRKVRALMENTARNRIEIQESFVDEPLWINGDAGNINQALVNLAINGIEAMPAGGTLCLRTAILDEPWVEVSVGDNGKGMAPEVLAHVLEPFYTTREVGKGTGLGLSMTYGVMKAHGGSIHIASQPGAGTTVALRFPRIPAPDQNPAVSPSGPSPSLEALKVLLVDDEEPVRILMTQMLQALGICQVKTASGGKKALGILGSQGLPDLVILDQNMPGMDGFQTLVEIRRLNPGLPVLIASGQQEVEAWDCFKLPRVGVISKPFNLEEIRTKLAQLAAGS